MDKKQLDTGRVLTVVERTTDTVTVKDEDGDYLTFVIDPRGIPSTYEQETT